MSVRPISAFRPVAPDADWEGLRARIIGALAETAPGTWTDHNAVDPGVTLAEAAAFGLADLHYRTATHASMWPMEVTAWLAAGERHWHAALPLGGMAGLADTLAGPAPAGTGTRAQVLEPLVRACAAPDDALSLLARSPWAGEFDAAEAPAVISLLRARWVRQMAHEFTDLVSAAVDAELSTGGSLAERDARAAAALGFALPLWPTELAAVVRRERRRRTAEAVSDHLDEIIAATTGPAVAAVRAGLAARDLTADEVDVAMGASPVPLGGVPEDFEEADGASRLWPPHTLQSLTCEPVTALDYARRARAHNQVGRAWAVPNRLVGVGWDGRPVTAAEERKGAVTLVVERIAGSSPTTAFLRQVLAVAIGSEVIQPHPTWRDTLDPLDPRRLICDEVGATLLKQCPVTLKGRLVTGVGVDRAATIAGALARVAAHFATGRPESRPTPVATPLVDGPWERYDQPADGWTPGEAIRFTEVVQAIVADPTILGIEDLAIRVGPNTAPFVPSSAGTVGLAADCVPVPASVQCLRVQFVLQGECTDA